MPKIQFFILIFNLWANRGGTDQWVGCVVSHFPSLCWRSDKIPLLLPVLLASADLPEELLLSPCACCSECLLSSPCPPTYHPPIHPPTVHQSSKGPVAGWTRGGEKWTRVCVCVCVDSGVERVRKKARKKGGWVGLEMQHSVLFISTVSYGTLGKWNACSSGWLQQWSNWSSLS